MLNMNTSWGLVQNAELEKKLEVLRGASGGISTEERQKVDEQFSRYIGQWRRVRVYSLS